MGSPRYATRLQKRDKGVVVDGRKGNLPSPVTPCVLVMDGPAGERAEPTETDETSAIWARARRSERVVGRNERVKACKPADVENTPICSTLRRKMISPLSSAGRDKL